MAVAGAGAEAGAKFINKGGAGAEAEINNFGSATLVLTRFA